MNATIKELDAFYGTETTMSQFQECAKRQTESYDSDDLIDSVNENQESILALLASGDHIGVGRLIMVQRQETIERRINIEMFGRV